MWEFLFKKNSLRIKLPPNRLLINCSTVSPIKEETGEKYFSGLKVFRIKFEIQP